MASTLDRAIQDLFGGYCRHNHDWHNVPSHPKDLVFMVSKIDDTFEIPVVMVNTFDKVGLDMGATQRISSDEIVVPLWYCGHTSSYVSFDAAIKFALSSRFEGSNITKLSVKTGNTTVPYYVTQGIIFDSTMTPVMSCNIECKRNIGQDSNGNTLVKFEGVRQIVRINPDCFIRKSNQIERFVSNKFPSTFLEISSIGLPYGIEHVRNLPREVIVSRSWPFRMVQPSIPKSDVTNKELLQVAIDHIADAFP